MYYFHAVFKVICVESVNKSKRKLKHNEHYIYIFLRLSYQTIIRLVSSSSSSTIAINLIYVHCTMPHVCILFLLSYLILMKRDSVFIIL